MFPEVLVQSVGFLSFNWLCVNMTNLDFIEFELLRLRHIIKKHLKLAYTFCCALVGFSFY